MIEMWEQKQSVHQEVHPSGENFEAVVTFKQYCDKTTASQYLKSMIGDKILINHLLF